MLSGEALVFVKHYNRDIKEYIFIISHCENTRGGYYSIFLKSGIY